MITTTATAIIVQLRAQNDYINSDGLQVCLTNGDNQDNAMNYMSYMHDQICIINSFYK